MTTTPPPPPPPPPPSPLLSPTFSSLPRTSTGGFQQFDINKGDKVHHFLPPPSRRSLGPALVVFNNLTSIKETKFIISYPPPQSLFKKVTERDISDISPYFSLSSGHLLHSTVFYLIFFPDMNKARINR